MQTWDYPEELLRFEEQPRTIRRWTEDERARALICEEVRRQHEAIQVLLGLPAVAAEIQRQERLETYRREGFDWSQVRLTRQFWRITEGGTSRIKCRISGIAEENGVPHRIVAYSRYGSTTSEVTFGAEAFVASFGGWVEDDA